MHCDKIQASLRKFYKLALSLALLAIAAIAPITPAEATSDARLQNKIAAMYPAVATSDCTSCHSATPEGAGNATGPLAAQMVGNTTPDAILTNTLRNRVDDIFAPRFSAAQQTITFFSKASGSRAVSLASPGAFAFLGSTPPHNPIITKTELFNPAPLTPRLSLTGTGSSRTIAPVSNSSLKDLFGTIDVELKTRNLDGFFHSSLGGTVLHVQLQNELATLASSSFPVLVSGSASPQTIDVTIVNPDFDTLAYGIVNVTDNHGNAFPVAVTKISDTTARLSLTPPQPVMPSTFFVDVDLEIRETAAGGQTVTRSLQLKPVSGTNAAPIVLNDSFTIPENGTKSGVLACDIDTGSVPCNASGPASADADDNLVYRVAGNVVPKGIALTAVQSGLAHGIITINNDNTYTYQGTVSGSIVNRAEDFEFSVSDGIVSTPGKVTFVQTPVDDEPSVRASAGPLDSVVDVAIEVVSDQQKPTQIVFSDFVEDVDTAAGDLNFRILKFMDADLAGSGSIAPSTYGSYDPASPLGLLPGDALTYFNRKNKALKFYVYFRVANANVSPKGGECGAADTDCGRILVSLTLNGNGRHDDDDRIELAESLGRNYRSIPQNLANFPTNGNGACLNCHTNGNVTSVAPNCNSDRFFNALGRRLCRIDPFDQPFAPRLEKAILGNATQPGFEPTVTVAAQDRNGLEIPETAKPGSLWGAEIEFTAGLTLDGEKSKILSVYFKDANARQYFDIAIANRPGSGFATGRLRVKKKLSELSGTDIVRVSPLPVNYGARRDNNGTPLPEEKSEGFYPILTEDQSQAIKVIVKRALPVVNDDSFEVNTSKKRFELDVTANDEGVIEELVSVTSPAKGKVKVEGTRIIFESNGSETGSDGFTYKAKRKGIGVSEKAATVSLTIYDRGDALAFDDTFRATAGETADLPVQRNDLGRKPYAKFALVKGKPPKLGTAKISGDTISYTPAATGTDSFDYTISGGGETTTATVTVAVGKVSGDILAGAASDKALKPVAKALGDTCQSLERETPTAGQRKLIRLCNDLVDEHAAGGSIDGALDQIRNEETLVAGDAVQQHERASGANLFGRLDNVRGGEGRGLNLSQFSLQIDDNSISGAVIDATIDKTSEDQYAAPKGNLPWGVFIAGNVAILSQDSSSREAGFDLSGLMLTAGIDYALSERALIGVAISGGQSMSDIGATDSLSMRSVQVSGYGSFDIAEGLHLDGYGGFAFNRFGMDRRVVFSAGGQAHNGIAESAFDGESISAALRLKYDLPLGNALLSTYGALSYVAAWTDSYVEENGGIYSMAVGKQDFDTLAATIGTRLSGTITYDFGDIKPYIGVSYARRLDSDKRSVRSSWAVAGNGGSSFVMSTEGNGDNFGGFELGLVAYLLEGASVETGLSGSFSDGGFQEYTIRTSLNIPLGAPPPPEQVAPKAPVAPPPRKQITSALPKKSAAPGDGDSSGGGSAGGGGWN